jgi:hypothetical protein
MILRGGSRRLPACAFLRPPRRWRGPRSSMRRGQPLSRSALPVRPGCPNVEVQPRDTARPEPVPAICPPSCVHRCRTSAQPSACYPRPRRICHYGISAQNSHPAPCCCSGPHHPNAAWRKHQRRIGAHRPPRSEMRKPGSRGGSQKARQTPERYQEASDRSACFAPWLRRPPGVGHTEALPCSWRAHRQRRSRGHV